MPYYLITVITRDKGVLTGLRESDIRDIDKAWQHFEYQAKKAISEHQFKSFDLVMLSVQSQEVQDYLAKQMPSRA